MTKRYSDEEIQRIRSWASFYTFLFCALLAYAYGELAYANGYQNGYHAHLMGAGVMQDQPTYEVQKASFEIEVISEPGDLPEWKQMLNWLMSYWIFGWIAIAFLAFYKAATYRRKRNSATVIGSDNVVIQHHE